MKNYISEEEKRKQIEQMWEEYERASNAHTHVSEQTTTTSSDSDYNESIDDNMYEDVSEKRQHGNKRKNKQGKQNKKKNKFSRIPDEDYS